MKNSGITVTNQTCNPRDILGMTDLKSESRKNTTHAGSSPADTTICADKASWKDNWGTLV